jgi:hypothetical protein
MEWSKNLKDLLDWGKRVQFAYQIVTLLLSASVVGAVRAMIYNTSVPYVWRVPVYLFSAGVALLLFSLPGRMLHRRSQVITPETKDTLEEIMRQGGHAALYDYMAGTARNLSRDLNLLWHHWDNAGEKLIHPLTGELEKPKGDNFFPLVNERRDFMVMYSNHLAAVKGIFPEFTSQTMKTGYPSHLEYAEVYRDLLEHAKELDKYCEKTWELYGRPLDK